MSHDPERTAEVGAWLARAGADLRAGEHGLIAESPFVSDAVFHAQQAAEKAMKAFLAWHDVPFRKTHDLTEIGRQCIGIDTSLDDVCRRAEGLTVFAWLFRYPVQMEDRRWRKREAPRPGPRGLRDSPLSPAGRGAAMTSDPWVRSRGAPASTTARRSTSTPSRRRDRWR